MSLNFEKCVHGWGIHETFVFEFAFSDANLLVGHCLNLELSSEKYFKYILRSTNHLKSNKTSMYKVINNVYEEENY